jgi:hypothetical protein
MTQNKRLLTSIWFIIGLIILLLNDFVFKTAFGNWFTGKLSDFAGLFIFPLFWVTLFPKQKNKIFFLTALIFIYWKSSYSNALISLWNSIGIWNIDRTIDYSDIIALGVLPIAYHLETIKEKLTTISLSPYIPLIICLYAFMATTRDTCNTYFEDNEGVYYIKHHSRESFMDELKNTGLDITSTKYNHTKYDDEHTEIHNLNDSIANLVIIIGDFNNSNKTVKVSLGFWDYVNNPSYRMLEEEKLKNEKTHIKSLFEKKVISKLSKY